MTDHNHRSGTATNDHPVNTGFLLVDDPLDHNYRYKFEIIKITYDIMPRTYKLGDSVYCHRTKLISPPALSVQSSKV